MPPGTRVRRAPALAAGLLLALLTMVAGASAASATTTTPSPTESAPAPTESAPATGDGESIRVLVRLDREPAADVEFRVLSGEDEVATGKTDGTGETVVPVPGPGTYSVEIDLDSLPEGTSLRNPDRNPAETVVNPRQIKPLAFPLIEGDAPLPGEGGTSTTSQLDQLPQLLIQGLRFGLILALAAIGLSVIFGTTGLTNFAHGELITFGALIGWFFNVVVGLPVLVAAPLAVLAGAGAGLLQDYAIWAPLRRRGTGLIAMMIVSIGLGLALRYFFAISSVFGPQSLFFNQFRGQQGIDFGIFRLRPLDIWSMSLAIIVLLVVSIALLRTRIGKATRAVADNPALAAASGIDVDRVIRTVWVTGGALAALSGVLLGLGQGMNFLVGFSILLLVFASVTLGGLGTAFGALIGSIIVGVFIEVSTLVLSPELKNVGALVLLIVILLVRPQGILGRAERVG